MSDHSADDLLTKVDRVLAVEAAALGKLRSTLAEQRLALATVLTMVLQGCGAGRGRLVVTGVGKAGLVGRKLAATFASTGTPSFFLHPTEARHGDLGMLVGEDLVLALSNSGASEELVALLPSLSHIGCAVIALVGAADSPLARHASVALSIGTVIEACPLGLAPSTSTTTLMALGDALALTVQELRRFTPEQYARFHPGGALGRKLMTCDQAMRTGERLPLASPDLPLMEAIAAITRARAGSVVLVDDQQRLVGIFTDGDMRRAVAQAGDLHQLLHAPVRQQASIPCRHIRSDDLLQVALRRCGEHRINELPVVDAQDRVVGLLDLQDLVLRGFTLDRI